ncbi:DUF1129 family protein [Pullulanibacillus sp. KACC 23026]|uniref:DUF1129 family protein n=1 Tax=Pullulanibacillus sp. KACC 23026 TaxID=3028315 RepID=UPI0023B13E4F|nr:DUF1129 family protein [Pullulanibacillus sp. KACC 23026]WEG14611.1 DUF1129 family protein [Pullulanibacillus sp. KACC 23026]
MELSKESLDFLDDLKLYLISSGKNEEEVKEVVEELIDHLYEAEKKGKSVKTIIGKTPKEYMRAIAKEMAFDSKDLIKYITIFILGAFAFLILSNALSIRPQISLLELIGYPVLFVLFLFLVAIVFNYISSHTLSKRKEAFIYFFTGCTPLILFIGLLLWNQSFKTPTFHLGASSTIASIIIAMAIFIGVSVWSKTWVLIIIPTLIYLPQFIINHTTLNQSMKLIFSLSILFIGAVLFAFFSLLKTRKAKKKENLS